MDSTDRMTAVGRPLMSSDETALYIFTLKAVKTLNQFGPAVQASTLTNLC